MMHKQAVIRASAMVAVLVLLGVYFTWQEPKFVSPRNMSQLVIELSITAVLALGMLLVILPGHIDLSVGSGLALMGGAAAVAAVNWGWPAWGAMAAVAGVSVVVYGLVGTVIVKQRMPAFIITLGGLLAFRGLHWKVTESRTIPVAPGGVENVYSLLTTYTLPGWAGWGLAGVVSAAVVVTVLMRRRAPGRWVWVVMLPVVAGGVWMLNQDKGVPLPAVILGGVALGVYVLTRHTRMGRYLYAIGGNEEAARLSGVPVAAVCVGAFAINGFIVALSGFLNTAYQGSTSPKVGEWAELYAIAACVIGGASLRGGRGTVLGVIFGALIMAELLVGMRLMGALPESRLIASGVVLALAVWLDVRLSRG